MKIVHRGHELDARQKKVLEGMVDALNARMAGKLSQKKFVAMLDEELEKAGCPVPKEHGPIKGR